MTGLQIDPEMERIPQKPSLNKPSTSIESDLNGRSLWELWQVVSMFLTHLSSSRRLCTQNVTAIKIMYQLTLRMKASLES